MTEHKPHTSTRRATPQQRRQPNGAARTQHRGPRRDRRSPDPRTGACLTCARGELNRKTTTLNQAPTAVLSVKPGPVASGCLPFPRGHAHPRDAPASVQLTKPPLSRDYPLSRGPIPHSAGSAGSTPPAAGHMTGSTEGRRVAMRSARCDHTRDEHVGVDDHVPGNRQTYAPPVACAALCSASTSSITSRPHFSAKCFAPTIMDRGGAPAAHASANGRIRGRTPSVTSSSKPCNEQHGRNPLQSTVDGDARLLECWVWTCP